MSRKDSNKKLNGKTYKEDKIIEKLLVEFGIKKPVKHYKKHKYQTKGDK